MSIGLVMNVVNRGSKRMQTIDSGQESSQGVGWRGRDVRQDDERSWNEARELFGKNEGSKVHERMRALQCSV